MYGICNLLKIVVFLKLEIEDFGSLTVHTKA